MKNLVCVAAAALIVSAGAAVASPLTGDGTFENNYVYGQSVAGAPHATYQSEHHKAFPSNGKSENTYVNGQRHNSPLNTTPVAATGQSDSGD